MIRRVLILLLLITGLAVQGIAFQAASPRPPATPAKAVNLIGRWQVKFTMTGVEKNLILVSQARGVGSFLLLDTGPDDKPVADPQPAAWSQLSNDRVSFSGEAELPLGTCCRELGTLIFKGKFTAGDSISGKVIFVTSVEEDENPYKYRSLIGTFIATRMAK
jgi:hypothetical protein